MKWIVILFVILAFIAIGVVAAGSLSKKESLPRKTLSKIPLKENILSFTFRMLPKLYSGLVRVNDDIVLIDRELERLKQIETEFPRQQRIVSAERTNWQRIQKGLLTTIGRLETEIETVFVTYLVNAEKGKKLIAEQRKSLVTTLYKAIEEASPQIRRLKPVVKKSPLDKLKKKISG